MSKSIVRSIKNVTSGYTSAQVKVRNATSNDAWGPSGAEMDEIAQLTFDQEQLFEIMEIIDRRLNDKGKNWRHVLKALILLDYCLHVGSENVVRWSKDNLYIIKTLREFQYIDEEDHDQGLTIRTKAKELTALLHDDDRIRTERANRNHMRERLAKADDVLGYEGGSRRRRERDDSGRSTPSSRSGGRSRRNTVDRREEDDLKLAIEESKETARREEQRRIARASGEIGFGVTRTDQQHQSSGARPTTQRQDSGPNLIELEEPQQLQQQQYLSVIQTGASPQYTGAFSPVGAISPIGAVSPQYTGMTQQYTGYQQPQQQQQLQTGYQQQFQQPTGLQQYPQQTGVQMQQTGLMQQPTGMQMPQSTGMQQPQATGYGYSQQQQYRPSPLSSDFTGVGFGGYSSQQQQPNAMQSIQQQQTAYPGQFQTMQGTGMLQQQQTQSAYQPSVSSPLAAQPTGRNNPFRQA
ncbi:hypothetical protein BZA70DRAFT_281128 [Myxozyma melibiosi]|uniref:ENTH domain-containing protein n=1 Tax=Myxozyma melibiosi TaxID=54550 RepID=A0ABR1F417_9ASCO